MRINIAGIPSFAGALNHGTELGPKYLRKASLIEKLNQCHSTNDLGNVKLPDNLIRHNVAPIRNWPSPRLVWDEIFNQSREWFKEGIFTIVLGGGCSVFTGVFMRFHQMYGENAHILTIDNHIDMKIPSADVCMGATAYTLWFLAHENQWIKKPHGFSNARITAMGFNEDELDSSFPVDGIMKFNKETIIKDGAVKVSQVYLNTLPKDGKVIVHLDLDVICAKDLKSVYMPSPEGLPISIIERLLTEILKDDRIVGMVVTEFSGAYTTSEEDAKKVTTLISQALENRL